MLCQLLSEHGSLGLQAFTFAAVQFHLVQRLRQLLARVSQIRLLLLILTLRLLNFRIQPVAALRYLVCLDRSGTLLCHKLRPLVDCLLLRLLRLGNLLFQLDPRLK